MTVVLALKRCSCSKELLSLVGYCPFFYLFIYFSINCQHICLSYNNAHTGSASVLLNHPPVFAFQLCSQELDPCAAKRSYWQN